MITLKVRHDNSVSEMKALISEKSSGMVPIMRQKLVFKGRTMQDRALVGDYNLEDGCKVHLILQKNKNQLSATSTTGSTASTSSIVACTTIEQTFPPDTNIDSNQEKSKSNIHQRKSSKELKCKFEEILRERLVRLFPTAAVDKIMANLENEINDDSNLEQPSLDDLELMAKEKLNIR